MNFNIRDKWIILATLLVLTMILSVIYSSWPKCSALGGFEASVQVKGMDSGRSLLGFNTDQDALKFGTVSPGAWVKRSVYAQYKHKADVKVFMTGDLAPWVRIEPNNFSIVPNQTQQVFFELNVPLDIADGNYTGRARFCFKKK